MNDNSNNNSDLENLYDLNSNEKPPSNLDVIILQSAKESCEVNNAKSRIPKWLVALPTAAVVVFGVSLMLNVSNSPELDSQQSFLPQKDKAIKSDDMIEVQVIEENESVDIKTRSVRKHKLPVPTKPKASQLNSIQENKPSLSNSFKSETINSFEDQAAGAISLDSKQEIRESLSKTLPAPVLQFETDENTDLDSLIEDFYSSLNKKDYSSAKQTLNTILKNHANYDPKELINKLAELNGQKN